MRVLETARLRLRWLRPGDEAFVLELLTDPDFRANVGERGVSDLASAARYLAEAAAGYARHGLGMHAMELKAGGTVIGMCGLLRRDTHPDVELGFALLPAARRQGYTLEAAAALVRHGLETLGLSRIVAITAPGNSASMQLLARLGFRAAGL